MHLTEILVREAVVIKSPIEMAAYVLTVAELYDAAPVLDQRAAALWQDLARQNDQVLVRKIEAAGVHVEYTADDPYSRYTDDTAMMLRYMLWDMVVNHRLLIYSGHSDNHPAFSARQNVIFRTVHDYFTHGKLRAVFRRQIDAMGLGDRAPTPEQLREILPAIRLDRPGNVGHDFTVRGELNAFLAHSKLASPKVVPALFTEVVGQVCYLAVVERFPTQKVAILPGLDFRQVGVTLPGSAADRRRRELLALLPDQAVVASHVAAQPEVRVAALLANVSR